MPWSPPFRAFLEGLIALGALSALAEVKQSAPDSLRLALRDQLVRLMHCVETGKATE